jgi:hypothetical protein
MTDRKARADVDVVLAEAALLYSTLAGEDALTAVENSGELLLTGLEFFSGSADVEDAGYL